MAKPKTIKKSTSENFDYFKNQLAQKVLKVEEPALIQILDDIYSDYFKYSKKRISIEQYNRELDEAEKRIDSGKYIRHEDFIKEMKNW